MELCNGKILIGFLVLLLIANPAYSNDHGGGSTRPAPDTKPAKFLINKSDGLYGLTVNGTFAIIKSFENGALVGGPNADQIFAEGTLFELYDHYKENPSDSPLVKAFMKFIEVTAPKAVTLNGFSCQPAPQANLQKFLSPFMPIGISLHNSDEKGLCMANLVSKHPVASGQCEFALMTAAHCVNESGKKDQFGKIIRAPRIKPGLVREIQTPYGTISGSASNIIFSSEYQSAEHGNQKVDAALILFRAACDTANDNMVLKFAEKTPEIGEDLISIRVPDFARRAFDNHQPFPQSMAYSTTKIKVSTDIDNFGIQRTTFSAAPIKPGDSGGAVLNGGRLVSVNSTVPSGKFDEEGNSLPFDPGVNYSLTGTDWVKQVLATCYKNENVAAEREFPKPQAKLESNPEPKPEAGTSDVSITEPKLPESTQPRTESPKFINFKLPPNAVSLKDIGFDRLLWQPEGMWGVTKDGQPTRLHIDSKTGELLGGPNNEFPASEETKLQLKAYYEKFPNKFNAEEKKLIQLFLEALKNPPPPPRTEAPESKAEIQPQPRTETPKPQEGRKPLTQDEIAKLPPEPADPFGDDEDKLPNPPPVVQKPTLPPAGPLTDEDKKAIQLYTHGFKYLDGSPREKFQEYDFKDIPANGTGKLILAYFGNNSAEFQKMQALAKNQPLVEVRNYGPGTQEFQKAQARGMVAVSLDGLGRKITRYPSNYTGLEALRNLMNDPEVGHLKNYLEATQKKDAPPAEKPIIPHQTQEVYQRCNSCHNNTTAPSFPSFVYDAKKWDEALQSGNPQAIQWLKSFNSKVVHGEMLTHSGLNKNEGIGKDFKDQVATLYKKHLEAKSRTTKDKIGSAEAVTMVDPTKLSEYLSILKSANITDPEAKKDLLEFDAIWDTEGNPSWSWAADDGDAGASGQRPLTVEPAGPVKPHIFKQVDGKWIWKEPFDGGFAIDSNTKGIKKFVIIRFPRDASGNIIKGVNGTEERSRFLNPEVYYGYSNFINKDKNHSIWASFPDGTKVYEVLYNTSLGKPVVIDVLSREKRIASDGSTVKWATDTLRVDSSPEKIKAWAEKQDPETAKKILAAINNPQRDQIRSELGADGSGGTPFVINGKKTGVISGSKSTLTGISKETLLKMYSELPLESAAGSKGWQLESHDMFSNSHRGIAIDSKTCANCHSQASESFRDVIANAGLAPQSASDTRAYGNAPGYDGIISAPWFSKEALAQYGRAVVTAPDGRDVRTNNKVRYDMRPEWAKFFTSYNPAEHSPKTYRRTEKFPISDQELRSR